MRPIANSQKEGIEEEVAKFYFDWQNGTLAEGLISGIKSLEQKALKLIE